MSRGRPRKFVEAEVRSAIVDCFRTKGYAATSLDDLARATGLVRPSLYAAFGSKEQMFLGAMEDFAAGIRQQLEVVTGGASSAHTALTQVFETALDIYLDGEGGRGCLVFTTAAAEAPTHPEIRARLFEQIASNDGFLHRLLARCAPQADPPSLEAASALASATLHSLGIRARAGNERESLMRFAATAAEGIAALVAQPQATAAHT
ncbi:TetR/AcrR family transcriptional regulator [Nocardioides marinus]|nr:TetR/AcrR family transcriptional regulator [Nocardioides marinus]